MRLEAVGERSEIVGSVPGTDVGSDFFSSAGIARLGSFFTLHFLQKVTVIEPSRNGYAPAWSTLFRSIQDTFIPR
jgi:hypothetical protein